MTEKEMINSVEKNTLIRPDVFSEMTLAQTHQFITDFYKLKTLKKIETRRKQIFEHILKKKQRQLLVI